MTSDLQEARLQICRCAIKLREQLNEAFRGSDRPAWRSLTDHLVAVCESALLEVYEPKVRDVYDDALHKALTTVGRTENPDASLTITKVHSLGLRVDDVFERAEVDIQEAD